MNSVKKPLHKILMEYVELRPDVRAYLIESYLDPQSVINQIGKGNMPRVKKLAAYHRHAKIISQICGLDSIISDPEKYNSEMYDKTIRYIVGVIGI